MAEQAAVAQARQANQNITRANHVLPVCYQQSFTNADGELCVQFLDRDTPIFIHPNVVGKINDFYTRVIDGVESDGIEKFFNEHVEGEYAKVAKRIKEEQNGFRLRVHEIPTLLKFVATQIVRTEAHRNCVNLQAGATVPQESFVHNMHRKMKILGDHWMKHWPMLVFWTTLPYVGSQFITGDNPVICFVQDEKLPVSTLVPDKPKIIDLSLSLASPHNGFIVPLSPYVCLTVINSGQRKSVQVRPMQTADPHDVRDLNVRIYNQCVKFVAAQNPEHLSFHVK